MQSNPGPKFAVVAGTLTLVDEIDINIDDSGNAIAGKHRFVTLMTIQSRVSDG
jgi:hypothetical protein